MTTENDDNSFVIKMIEDFRAGGAERVRARYVASRLSFDQFDTRKRKRDSSSSSVTDNAAKLMKEEQSPIRGTPEGRTPELRKSLELNISGSKIGTPGGSPVAPASPWEMKITKRQLAEANIKISELESQINRLHSLRKEMELIFEKDRESYQKEVDTERSKAREVEGHLLLLRKRATETKEELAQCKTQLRGDKAKYEDNIFVIQKENAKMKDDMIELEYRKQQEEMATTRSLNQLKIEAADLERQLQGMTARNKELELQIGEYRPKAAKVDELQAGLQSIQIKMKELETEREGYRTDMAYVNSQQAKLFMFPNMEREIKELQERNKSLQEVIPKTMLLEEMLEDLKLKQANVEETENQLVHTNAQLLHLQSKLEEWYKFARDYCEGISPSQTPEPIIVKSCITELQQKVLILTGDSGEAKSTLNEMQHRNNLLTGEVQTVKKENEKLKNSIEQLNNKLKLLQKKVHLLKTERDCYRTQMDSYERELTISLPVGNQQPYNQQLQQRLETMEKVLDGYRQMMEKMEGDSDKTRGISENTALLEKITKLECERNKLLEEKRHLQKHKDTLEQELEFRVLKGDFNPTTSKVLHLRMNPASEAEEKYEDEHEKLKAECNRLRQRVKLLEEGNTQDITLKVEDQMTSDERAPQVQALKESMKSQEIKMQRIKEVYHSSAKEYREVCYELFGYKMDRNNNIYTLSNMYAESPDDQLMFKRMPDGTIDMMETPFSTTLGELIDLHLHQHHSLPLFLGAITVDLFNKQTLISASIIG